MRLLVLILFINSEELLQRFEKVVTDMLALIEKHTNEELYGYRWYGKWTMGKMIAHRTFLKIKICCASPGGICQLKVRLYIQ